ncbi:NADPH-dependent FMN reductase [Rhizobium sp. GCM10022189]|uniref:NADPH-dependent FMN reductase n=1 Tax=Rhizobium sp. GCM10022189 TaxID=3252654 RepID=UPI0036201A1A
MTPLLKIIIGSTRPGRIGPVVGKWVKMAVETHGGCRVELVDLADFNLPLLDEPNHPAMQQYKHEHTRTWATTIAEADGYIFVTPEYDYFPPASLVNAVQTLFLEWNYKAAGIVSYGGVSGGLRSCQALRSLLSGVNVHGIYHVVPIPFVSQSINGGRFVPTGQTSDGLNLMLGELLKWTRALKPMRS